MSWARATGYLVLYVPSGKAMCTFSNYSKDEASGLWNTPDHAALLIKWLQEGSASALEALGMTQTARDATRGPGRGADAGRSTPRLAIVEAFKSAARDQGKKVLFAVDEYNALFGPSDMHEVLGPRKRGNIPAGSTRVNAALRDATVDRGRGRGLRRRDERNHLALARAKARSVLSHTGPRTTAFAW